MTGTAHVIEQLGLAHQHALAVIEQQAERIASLEAEIRQLTEVGGAA